MTKEKIETVAAEFHREVDEDRMVLEAADSEQSRSDAMRSFAVACNQYAWLVGNTFGDHQQAVKLSQESVKICQQLPEMKPNYAGFLDTLVRQRLAGTLEVLTPAEPARRGAQLSLRVAGERGEQARSRGRELFDYLRETGILGDWREPDVIRIAPAPLYNRYSDVLRFVEEVEHWRGV